jgi:hypothetical protein
MIAFKPPKMDIREVSPEQMQKRVARYKSLQYPPDRYPDSQLPGHERRNYLVVGKGLQVEGGNDPLSAIPIDEGVQMSYVEAAPGTNVRQKAGLNRKILDKGWHMFELAVRNKARSTGTTVRTVYAPYTSLTCPEPACGRVDTNNRKSQAVFVCTACGHTEHADPVGAKNTLARGHSGHRAWRPRRQPVCEAPTSANPQGISAPTAEVGVLSASTDGRIVKSVMWDVTRVSLHET